MKRLACLNFSLDSTGKPPVRCLRVANPETDASGLSLPFVRAGGFSEPVFDFKCQISDLEFDIQEWLVKACGF